MAQIDTSKLVKVQRVVTRKGKTFYQDYWVKPDQVKSTDKVLAGQQNLLPSPGSVPKPAKGVLDTKYFDSIKSDRAKAMEYLKDCGITWKENANAGINWMRAMQAYTARTGANKQSSKSTQQNGSTNTKNSNTQTSASSTKTISDLTQAQIDEFLNAKTGKDKTVILKKYLKSDGVTEYARACGLKWNEHSHSAINCMRANMALQDYFNNLNGATPFLGTYTPKGNVGAPIGNQNAKKDDKVDNKVDDTPKQPKDLLEVPKDATQRQKNFIELLNSKTDEKELKLIAETGMIFEDKESAEFVENKLLTEYKKKFGSPDNVRNGITGGANSRMSSGGHWYYSGDSTLAKDIASDVSKSFVGVPNKSLVKACRRASFTQTGFANLYVDPRDTIKLGVGYEKSNVENEYGSFNSLFGMIQSATNFYSTYAVYDDCDDKLNNVNTVERHGNSAYKGNFTSISKKLFDKEKDGFCNMLNHISNSNPEMSNTCDVMKSNYLELMELCDYNLETLKIVTDTAQTWKAIERENKVTELMTSILDEISTDLRNQGYDEDIISSTLLKGLSDYRTGSDTIDLYKESRDLDATSTVSIYSWSLSGLNVLDPNTTKKQEYKLPQSVKDKIKDYKDNYGSIRAEKIISCMKGDKYSPIDSADKFDKARELSLKLIGCHLADKSTGVPITKKHSELESGDSYDLKCVPIARQGFDSIDKVLANMYHIMEQTDVASKLTKSVQHDAPASKANNQGQDYTGNFDFVSGTSIYRYINESFSTIPNSSAIGKYFKTGKEENDWVLDSLSKTKTLSSNLLDDLKDYVEDEGQKDFLQHSWASSRNSSELYQKAQSKALTAKKYGVITDTETNPFTDLAMDILKYSSGFCPQNYNTRVKTREDNEKTFDKKFRGNKGYSKHTFVKKVKSATPGAPAPVDSTQLYELRKKALKNANCSIKKCDTNKTTEVQHEVKINFDRVDKNGKRVHKAERVYDDRTLLFRDDVYEIKNSSFEENFEKDLPGERRTTFHGTSYYGALGILGVDGKWRYKSSDKMGKNAGTMLGDGIYSAKLVGKVCPYVGNENYAYLHYDQKVDKSSNNSADGIVIVMDTMLGKYKEFNDCMEARRNNKNNGGTYDSVAVGGGALMPGGSKLKEYEMIVTRNSQILPKYIVDCSPRTRKV